MHRARTSVGLLAATVLLVSSSAYGSNTPAAGSFHGCGSKGSPAQATNTLKNRSSQVGSPKSSTVSQLSALPLTGAKVAKLRSEGIVVEGFLLGVRQETQESCNCGDATLNDFHLWLTDKASDQKKSSAVVEMTPRWRAANTGWNLTAVRHLIAQKAKVRVTGWRYLDPNHQSNVGTSRASRWEIHPITKFEVFSGGQWQEL